MTDAGPPSPAHARCALSGRRHRDRPHPPRRDDLATTTAFRVWNALMYHIVIALLCIIMHAAAGDAGDRDLRGAGDDAPPSAQSGG